MNLDFLEKICRFVSNVEIMEYYGVFEFGFVIVIIYCVGSGMVKSVGMVFLEVVLNICDVDVEGNGEIWVKSDLIIEDYFWCDDDIGFCCDGDWSLVGDIGCIEGGNLYLISCVGGMVIIGGNNVYLDEVLIYLCVYFYIKDVVVLGIEDCYLGICFVVVVELLENGIM